MNKKISLIIIAITLLSFQLKAQLGVHIGYNFAKINGFETLGFEEKYLSNFSGGLFYDRDFSPFLDLRLGVMYSPKGSHLAYTENYYKTILNYIEVPLQAKIKVGPLYALGGVYGAYAINGRVKSHTEVLGVIVNTDDELDFENNKIKKEDFGLKFGAGVQLGVGPVKVFAQGEYSFGLMSIYDGDKSYKNNVIGVSVGAIIEF